VVSPSSLTADAHSVVADQDDRCREASSRDMLFRDAESKGNTADHLSRPARSLANCTTRCVRSLANCRAREPRSLANCDNHEARGLANCLVRCARSLANCRRRDSREVIEPTAQVSIVAGQRSRVPRSANLPRATSRPISLTTLSYAAHTCGRGRRPRGNRNSARGCRHERHVRLSRREFADAGIVVGWSVRRR
jgi:hypothetical protein